MGNNIHNKARFVDDIRYVRFMLRGIEAALRDGNWEELVDCAEEASGTIASLASRGRDNQFGVHDYDTIWSGDYERMKEEGVTRIEELSKITVGGITEVK